MDWHGSWKLELTGQKHQGKAKKMGEKEGKTNEGQNWVTGINVIDGVDKAGMYWL